MKKVTKHTSMGSSLGMCFGVSIGSSFGLLFDNMALGISMGISLGMAIGVCLGAAMDRQINAQLEEKGYSIKSIEENEEKQEYMITIVDKQGEEVVVPVSKSHMKAWQFSIGDVVFLNKAGHIEQVYDKQK